MNGKFKRAVSTAAAVALMASVFSGFSLTTASAAAIELETDYIGSKATAETFDGANYDGFLLQSPLNDSTYGTGSVTQSPWTFTYNADGRKSQTWVKVAKVTDINSAVSLSDYTQDNAMILTTRGNNSYPSNYMTYALDKAVSSGTVYLSTDFGTFLEGGKSSVDDGGVEFRDGAGNVVLSVFANGKNNYLYYNDKDHGIIAMPQRSNNDYAGGHLEIELNLDTQKAKVIATTASGTKTISDIALSASEIVSFDFYHNGGSSKSNYFFIDNTKLYHIGEVSADEAQAIAASDIDYGIGTWSYDGANITGTTGKTSAGIHYADVNYANSEGRDAIAIQVPFTTLPADNRTIELYVGAPATSDMQDFAKYDNVTIGDKTIKNYTDEKLFGATDSNGEIAGVDLANKTKIASIAFSTKDKKRVATVNVEGYEDTETITDIKDGDTVTLKINNIDFSDVDDLFLYNYSTDTSKDYAGGSIGDLVIVYQPEEANTFEITSDVLEKSGTNNSVVYLGKFNTTDLKSVTLTGTGNADVDSTVVLYETDTQTADFASAAVISAKDSKFAKAAESATIGVTGASGESKYLYAVLSATKDSKAVAPAQITGAAAKYESFDLTASGVTAQYLLENEVIDTDKVFKEDGTFDADYLAKFEGYVSQLSTIKSYGVSQPDEYPDVPGVFTEFNAQYTELKSQVAGWQVVKAIDSELDTEDIYDYVVNNDEKEQTNYEYLNTTKVEVNEEEITARELIKSVNEDYAALNTIGQKFVGGQNYDVLAALVKILNDGDEAIVNAYNDAIAAVWDVENSESKLTQDNYLYAGQEIADLYDLQESFDSIPDDLKKSEDNPDGLDEELIATVIAGIKAQILEGTKDDGSDAFSAVTAAQFDTSFAKVYEAYYKTGATYDDKLAALKIDGIDSTYAEIADFEKILAENEDYAEAVTGKIGTLTGQTKDNYELYTDMTNAVDTYAKAQLYLDAVDALKASIEENQGVDATTYETMAEAYNNAVKLKEAYDKAADTQAIDDEATLKEIISAQDYMDRAIAIINSALEGIIADAKDVIDAAVTNHANEADGIQKIKFAIYYFDKLATDADHANGSLGHAQDALAATEVTVDGETTTYGEFIEDAAKLLEEYNETNAAAIKKLLDDNTDALTDAVKTWNYKTTNFDALTTTYDAVKTSANGYNLLIQWANGEISAYNSSSDKNATIDVKKAYKIVASTAVNEDCAAIKTNYSNAEAFMNSITNLSKTGTAYETAVIDLANMILSEENAIEKADDITGDTWTDEYIKKLAQDAYDEGRIDFESEYVNKPATDGSIVKTTKDNRAAVTTALSAYEKAIATYNEQFVKNTDATETDFDIDPEERDYTSPWADQTIIDQAQAIDDAIGAVLAAEKEKAEGIQKSKDEKSDAAKEAVDALMAEIDALYDKLSDPECAYEDYAAIVEDMATYDELAARPAEERQNTDYIYVDNSTNPVTTTNYYDLYYKAAAGASKLAYIESALNTWSDAMDIIEAARAVGDNVPALDSKTNKWSIANLAAFNEVKALYDALPVDEDEDGNEIPGAEKVNVNNVLGETYFTDQAYANTILADVITNYAQPVTNIGTIDSVAKYNTSKTALDAVNAYVKKLQDTVAAKAGDKVDGVEVTEQDITDAAAALADIALYFGDVTTALEADNDAAAIIGPAAEFDAAVDAITGSSDTENIAKATKLIEAIRASENASEIIPYITKYAIYENYVNANDKTIVDAFAALVKTAQDVEDSYADPKAADFKAAYDAAVKAYEAMTDTQKSKASIAYGQLTAAKEANDKYVAGNAAITAVTKAIGTLQATYGGDGSELTTANYDAAKASSDAIAADLVTIQNTYGDDALAAVTNQGIYKDIAAAIEAFGKIVDTCDLIDAIGTVTAESGDAIAAARAAYDALTTDQQAKVSNYILLVEAEKAYAELPEVIEAQKAADAVEAMIDAIGTVTAENAADKQAEVEAARAAYDALTDLQKSLVDNLDVLEAAEKVISENVIQPGDVNGDGNVNALDIFAVIDHILGRTELTGTALTRADMNNDGSVDISDVLQIIKAWA